jgi:hypothetical protein
MSWVLWAFDAPYDTLSMVTLALGEVSPWLIIPAPHAARLFSCILSDRIPVSMAARNQPTVPTVVSHCSDEEVEGWTGCPAVPAGENTGSV